MNNEYYGVASTPMDDYLAHYGIKGMKWGVRKAIERGSQRALSRQYRKAEKKLAKLEDRANAKHQMNIARAARKSQRISAALGAANVGISAGLTARSIKNAVKTGSRYANTYIPVGAGFAAANAIGQQIRKKRALNRATGEGHKQAVREAQAFRNEMKKSFKGTQYAKQIGKRARQISQKNQRRYAKYSM